MIITAYNYVEHHTYADGEGTRQLMIGETNNLPSMTVPGMTMGLKEMLERYVRGGDVETFQGTYTDADIPDNLERMTEMDKLDLAREIKQSIEVHQKGRKKPTPADVVEPDQDVQNVLALEPDE